MVAPIQSYPASNISLAATELSTPPLMAINAFFKKTHLLS